MSRFDRRMGTGPYAKSNAPRRYRPNVNDKKSDLPTRNDIISTNEIMSKTEMTYSTSNIINNVSEKNERILKKLEGTRNSSERILLNHELRLNTVELTVDCFNNMNTSGNDFNTIVSQQQKIETLEKTVEELGKKLVLLTQMIEKKSVVNEKDTVIIDINDIAKNSINEKVEKIVEDNEEGPTFE
jgi:hypothetical protein